MKTGYKNIPGTDYRPLAHTDERFIELALFSVKDWDEIKTAFGWQNFWNRWEDAHSMLYVLGNLSYPKGPQSDDRKKLALILCEIAEFSVKYNKIKIKGRSFNHLVMLKAWAENKETTLQKALNAFIPIWTDHHHDHFTVITLNIKGIFDDYKSKYPSAAIGYHATEVVDSIASRAAYDAKKKLNSEDADDWRIVEKVREAAKKEVLKQCADIVRKYHPKAPKL